MSHFAKVENGIVTNVIVAGFSSGEEGFPSKGRVAWSKSLYRCVYSCEVFNATLNGKYIL